MLTCHRKKHRGLTSRRRSQRGKSGSTRSKCCTCHAKSGANSTKCYTGHARAAGLSGVQARAGSERVKMLHLPGERNPRSTKCCPCRAKVALSGPKPAPATPSSVQARAGSPQRVKVSHLPPKSRAKSTTCYACYAKITSRAQNVAPATQKELQKHQLLDMPGHSSPGRVCVGVWSPSENLRFLFRDIALAIFFGK